MIDKNELDALERVRDAVVEGISDLIRTMQILGGCIAIWMALLFAMTWWLK